MRLWAGFLAEGLQRHAAGAGLRPLLVVLDCKGGADARRVADRARRVLREAGARSTAIWPDEASLSLWALPARQLITTLADMIERGTGPRRTHTTRGLPRRRTAVSVWPLADPLPGWEVLT